MTEDDCSLCPTSHFQNRSHLCVKISLPRANRIVPSARLNSRIHFWVALYIVYNFSLGANVDSRDVFGERYEEFLSPA